LSSNELPFSTNNAHTSSTLLLCWAISRSVLMIGDQRNLNMTPSVIWLLCTDDGDTITAALLHTTLSFLDTIEFVVWQCLSSFQVAALSKMGADNIESSLPLACHSLSRSQPKPIGYCEPSPCDCADAWIRIILQVSSSTLTSILDRFILMADGHFDKAQKSKNSSLIT
jgi:hypothetical protein